VVHCGSLKFSFGFIVNMKNMRILFKPILHFVVLLFVVNSLQAFALDGKKESKVADENTEVINNMKMGGFDFSRPHVVDFFALFSTKKQANVVAEMYRNAGKKKTAFKLVEVKKDENGDYELLVQVLMDVTYENITGFENTLTSRALATQGKFNGWGIFQ